MQKRKSKKHDKHSSFESVFKYDPKFIQKMSFFFDGLYRHYFRCEISGWENVPEKNSLFVGNHNGLLSFEVLMLFHAWNKKYKHHRKAVGLTHDFAIENPTFKWLVPKLGGIPADFSLGLQAFQKDFSVLVYPGGERECFRSSKHRKKIQFYQRKGFIRLALEANVPIVPIVSIGAHETYWILHDSEKLADKLGLKKYFRIHSVPITLRGLFLAWCIVSGFFTLLPLSLVPAAFLTSLIPLPAKMKFRILPAIDIHQLWSTSRTEEENLEFIYHQVINQMQHALDEEYQKRKYPILG